MRSPILGFAFFCVLKIGFLGVRISLIVKKCVSLPDFIHTHYTYRFLRKMLIESISKYLLSNKRLVVPNLGAFIVKVPGEKILFSNLMKSDDGILRRLLTENGISELEAAGLIDRFVFEVNYRLQNSGVCDIKGFGRMIAGANGSISFEYNSAAQGDNLEGDMPMLKAAEKRAAQEAKAEPVVVAEEPKTTPEPAVETVIEPQRPVKEKKPYVERSVEPTSSTEPQLRRVPVRRIYGETPSSDRRVRPENYTKGLRYSKGNKVVTGRESATSRRTNKGDIIIKIAIAAALIAILALAYGLYNDWRFGSMGDEGITKIDNREIYDVVPASAEDGVRNPDLDYITPNE